MLSKNIYDSTTICKKGVPKSYAFSSYNSLQQGNKAIASLSWKHLWSEQTLQNFITLSDELDIFKFSVLLALNTEKFGKNCRNVMTENLLSATREAYNCQWEFISCLPGLREQRDKVSTMWAWEQWGGMGCGSTLGTNHQGWEGQIQSRNTLVIWYSRICSLYEIKIRVRRLISHAFSKNNGILWTVLHNVTDL